MYKRGGSKKRSLFTTLLLSVAGVCLTTTFAIAQNDDASNTQRQQLQQLSTILKQNPQLMQQLTAIMQQDDQQQVTSMVDVEKQSATTVNEQSSSDQNAKNVSSVDIDTAKPQQTPNDYWASHDNDTTNSAFQSLQQTAFPLTPQQIEQMHNMLDDTQRAVASEPYNTPPHPTSSSLLVNLSPGSVPPVIRLARGFVSSLVFIDSTGAPWPVQAYDLGNPQAFNIKWNQKDNTLMIQARSSYTYGNIAVVLQGLDTPVMLTLVPGQKVVDYRVDLRVQGTGPNAKLDAIQATGLSDISNPQLLSVLDGIPPQKSQRLTINGGGGQAWLLDDKIYLRTRYNVISPAWFAKMSSADGMHAYELPVTPVVLLSHYGKTVSIKIAGL